MSKASASQKNSSTSTAKTDAKTDAKAAGEVTTKPTAKLARTSGTNRIHISDRRWYISRELSWLEFNRRVLHEAMDERTPLLERLKFLGIFSANLDEYFMVRVAVTKQQIDLKISKRTPDGLTPPEQLRAISQRLRPMFTQTHTYFQSQLRPQMSRDGIYLLGYSELTPDQRDYLARYFNEQVFPVLTPLAVDSGHPFPYISNLSLNLAVEIQETESAEPHFARVKVPKVLPRFVTLPEELWPQIESEASTQDEASEDDTDMQQCHWAGVPMEQIISNNIAALFPGMDVKSCSAFRITRNADLEVEEDEADDLMMAIEQELRKRRIGGSVVRMELETGMSPVMKATLMSQLKIQDDDVYEVEGLLGLADLMSLIGLPLPELQDSHWQPVIPSSWRTAVQQEGGDVFSLIRRRDRLVHHPYQSFSGTVQAFITQAATDPGVLAIKMTLYRTSGDSPIVNALIKAAENGKQVVALVELKARFDEENNINWARTLERSGVHVVYGLVGLKTHTKVALVVRREKDTIRRYVHIGTGNYNPKTARLYTDLGLMSCRPELGTDLTDLFNYLTGYSRQHTYQKLLIAPMSLRQQMTAFIQHEAKLAQQNRPGRIIVKMNALVDSKLITELYKASQAGVKIDLIIRGICCLRPGIEGLSDNIRVISIIGRFLEHSRIFYFQNEGDEPRYYIGSADWMPRNLDRRVEALVPIEEPSLRKRLDDLLETCLSDNRQAWEMQPDGTYVQRQPEKGDKCSTHKMLMKKALQEGC
ncbi:MAG: polyphosphate kinase 1 [Phormidesmis sp.]